MHSHVSFEIYTAVSADESYLAQNNDLEWDHAQDLTHYSDVRTNLWQDYFEEGMSDVAQQDASED